MRDPCHAVNMLNWWTSLSFHSMYPDPNLPINVKRVLMKHTVVKGTPPNKGVAILRYSGIYALGIVHSIKHQRKKPQSYYKH